jgi:hypothetical protein
MDSSILLIVFIAWAISCLFYLQKISKIAHSSRLSIFSPVSKYHRTLRNLVKRLFRKIFIITLVFMIAVFIIFFVKSSS